MGRLFAFLLAGVLVFVYPLFVYAENIGSTTAYDLPYPGLLPDSPFYFLKGIRDKVTGFFISNPVKKASFDLLQADKRVAASYMLLDKDKGKVKLAESTFSKGVNYFEDALGKVTEAKKQGMDTRDTLRRLVTANLKHQEVIRNMEGMTGGTDKNEYLGLEERVRKLGNTARQIIQ